MSPEMLERKKYNYKNDIFSIGVIAYAMLFKSLPFNLNKKNDDMDLDLKNML